MQNKYLIFINLINALHGLVTSFYLKLFHDLDAKSSHPDNTLINFIYGSKIPKALV